MKEQVIEFLNKIPFTLVTAAVVGWMALDYYDFQSSDSSLLQAKGRELAKVKRDKQKVERDVASAKQFFKTLETKKIELRSLMRKLTEMKASLNETIDKVAVQETINEETAKASLRFLDIAPGPEVARELYVEQVFDLQVRGVYGQLVFFLKRLSLLEQILRVDEFSLEPFRESRKGEEFVTLNMNLKVRAFRYLRSEADRISDLEGGGVDQGGGAKSGQTNSSGAVKKGGV